MAKQLKTASSDQNLSGVNIKEYMLKVGEAGRESSRVIGRASSGQKNEALRAAAREILRQKELLQAENEKDLQSGRQKGLSDPLIDRLTLTEARINTMVEGLEQVAQLKDPIGEITDLGYQPSGIQVGKMRVPLGVIGIIYESRPNVTIEAGSLCLKSGNATILRGGSEAIHTNLMLADCLRAGLLQAGLPEEIIQLVATTDREAVGKLITMDRFVDVIVPRGGKGLIERISGEATIPVIKHLDGICHVYIDDDADVSKAIDIAFNAKTQRYGVCNSMETLLLAESMVEKVLPDLAAMYIKQGVELRGCQATVAALSDSSTEPVKLANDEDWETEYLAPILSIRIVKGLDQAIEHINHYGSQHTDCIVTENYSNGRRFLREVDSSSVMINVSPRFSDGFEYGLGAEIGISTDKLHARGPVGLEGLTSQKYVVLGDGQIRL